VIYYLILARRMLFKKNLGDPYYEPTVVVHGNTACNGMCFMLGMYNFSPLIIFHTSS